MHPNIIPGTSVEAKNWIDTSKLPQHIKLDFLTFVNRFPEAEFYRLATSTKPELPEWANYLRTVFAGAFPEQLSWFQFHPNHFALYEPEREPWINFQYKLGYGSEYPNIFLDEKLMLTVGNDLEIGAHNLAMDLSEEYGPVYSFALDEIRMSEKGGQLNYTRKIFDNIAHMYSKVYAIKSGDGKLFESPEIAEFYKELDGE